MVFLLILLLSSFSNGVFGYGETEIISLKRLPTVLPRNGPTRLLQKSRLFIGRFGRKTESINSYQKFRLSQKRKQKPKRIMNSPSFYYFYLTTKYLLGTENGATTLEMKHYTSTPVRDWSKHHEQRLDRDRISVKSIQSRIKKLVSSKLDSSQAQIPINSGIKLQTLNYIVTITLASQNLTLIVDTGSDFSWVQCQPCRLCYTQPEPLFNPTRSPSYRPVQCTSQPCHTMQYTMGKSGVCGSNTPKCNYAVTYGDGSYSRGELASDRLTLGTALFEGFVFGCGRNNRGLFGEASGLIGLGRSDLSLVSQTYDVFGGVFTYCLPDSDSGASGSLTLGHDTTVFKNTTPLSYTRLVQNPQLDSFYVLNMTAATVGGVTVESPGFGKNGILIDSGTVITRLPPSIYLSLKREFMKQFVGHPSAPSFSILDTCFDLSAYEEVSIPTLRMQFEGGGEMSVDVSGMFYFAKRDGSQVCLALASLAYEGEIGIIGNYQQRNTRVVYDTKEMQVGFAKEVCSFN